jgi:hypothetical protein
VNDKVPMKFVTMLAAASMLAAGSVQAEAKIGIKGAIMGGAAGYYLANCGPVGAVAGCLGDAT